MQADLRVVSNEQYPFALAYFTGSKEHNVKVRGLALNHGWTLNEYRLAPAPGKKARAHPRHPTRSAISIARWASITSSRSCAKTSARSRPPPRTNCPASSICKTCAALFTTTPPPATAAASLEEMAAAAQDLGLEYLGIADHSKSSFQAHGLG